MMRAIVFYFYSETGTCQHLENKIKTHRKLMQQSFSTRFQNVYLFREKKRREKEKKQPSKYQQIGLCTCNKIFI